jgi:hypothetical protein
MSVIVGKNFSYSVDYTYNTQYSCKESGCDWEGICRCGTIYDEHIKSVDIQAVVGDIYSEYFDNTLSTERDNKLNSVLNGISKEINIYTIDRIVRHFDVQNSLNWEIEVEGGYYGQEIGDVIISDEIARKIEQYLEIAFSIDDLSGRIEYLLGLEYGHLLPELVGKKYEVISVDKKDLIFGSEGHYKKVKNKKLDHYSDYNYDGIRGIVIEKERKAGNQFRLIDGYHRCSATKRDKVKVLKAF